MDTLEGMVFDVIVETPFEMSAFRHLNEVAKLEFQLCSQAQLPANVHHIS